MTLLGVWKAKWGTETRYINVTVVDTAFARGYACDARGLRLPGARETRVRLTSDGKALQRYVRPGGAK